MLFNLSKIGKLPFITLVKIPEDTDKELSSIIIRLTICLKCYGILILSDNHYLVNILNSLLILIPLS